MKQRAVFLDRDGTLSEEVGYISNPTRFRLYPYTAEAISKLHDNGWLVIVVTNQSGVARGYFPEEMVHEVHQILSTELNAAGTFVDAIYYCAHHPAVGDERYRLDCGCRKPKPGLILTAGKDFDLDLSKSWMIGDRYSDIELAHNAGTKSVLVMTGYGRGEWENQKHSWKHQPDIVADDLLEAVELLLKKESAVTEA
jgi:D-glycero-D-manno-heptose 1,7-bisphosphate phosphatase